MNCFFSHLVYDDMIPTLTMQMSRKAQVIATERKVPEEAKNEENSQLSNEEVVEEIESSH